MAKPKGQRETEKARKFFRGLSRRDKNQLGDELVRGTFEWSEWMRSKPSAAFLRALDEERIDWEIREENPRKSLGSKMPEMSDDDWVRLEVSQDLRAAASRLGGADGRVEVTARTQENVRKAADAALAKLDKAGVQAPHLRERATRLKDMAALPNSALNLFYEMSRARGMKLRVTKARQIDGTILVQRGYAKSIVTPSGTEFFKVAWAENPEENPAREENPLGNLPAKASRMWEHVYESGLKRGQSKGAAAAQAWCAVKRRYYKKGDQWRVRKDPLSKEEYPPGCEPYTGKRAANPAPITSASDLARKLKF